jgi:hypothetical protein
LWLQDPRVLLVIYVAAAAITALQKIDRGSFQSGGMSYPPLQNYVIFRNAFHHLLAGQDLYARFPLEQADLFKYTPTFALLMAPIAALPYSLGAIAWNLVNALALFGAVMWVSRIGTRTKSWTLWFVAISLVSSMQSAQSNGLMAGLMLAAFAARERGLDGISALAVVLAAFVKPFGAVAILPCLTQPRRGRFLLYAALSGIVLGLAPLAAVPAQHLAFLYRSWLHLLQSDHAVKTGTSLITWLRAWFGLAPPKELVVAAGGVLLLLPLGRLSLLRDEGARLLLIASVLIWVVIFNHMAEPPTYVIAVLGVALWYFGQRSSPANTVLFVATFLLTCLAATDLYPRSVRVNVISRYVLRAAPCIFVWFKLQYDLLARRPPGPNPPVSTRVA